MASLRRALISVRRMTSVHRIINSTSTSNRIFISSPLRTRYGSFSRYSTTNDSDNTNRSERKKSPYDVDLSTEESKRIVFNRLLYRSKQTGILELDLVLGKWVEENIENMDIHGVKALIHLLEFENPDLWKWLSGQEDPPIALKINPVFSLVRDKIAYKVQSHTDPDTLAMPGDPWVRGWDDIKNFPGDPVAGNQ